MTQVRKCTILEKEMISHDTMLIKISCDNTENIPDISFFVFIYNEKGDKNPYTPISWTKNSIRFVIKHYKRNGISVYIYSKNIQDKINISTFLNKLKYNSDYKNILMICGGTGITPMLQILNYEEDSTKFTIIDCNKTYNDILINRNIIKRDINIFHVLSRENGECSVNKNLYFINENEKNVYKERISIEVVKRIMDNIISKPDFVYVCGPPTFMEEVSGNKTPSKEQGELQGILKDLGFEKSRVYKF